MCGHVRIAGRFSTSVPFTRAEPGGGGKWEHHGVHLAAAGKRGYILGCSTGCRFGNARQCPALVPLCALVGRIVVVQAAPRALCTAKAPNMCTQHRHAAHARATKHVPTCRVWNCWYPVLTSSTSTYRGGCVWGKEGSELGSRWFTAFSSVCTGWHLAGRPRMALTQVLDIEPDVA